MRNAIERCFTNLHRRSPSWILEGDIKGCFDNISHRWLLDHIPMDGSILRKWLKSGYLENQIFYDTISGTPQGGIISPVLANFALDGLEKRLLEAFPVSGPGSWRGKAAQVHLIRYADDFVITANSREILVDRVKPLVEAFLAERGLVLSPEKTLITHVSEGFDFLGQNVRRYPNGKLLIKPSRKSVRSFLTKIQGVVKQLWSAPAVTLIARLNPIIRGWTNYHRHVVSKRVFSRVDYLIFRIIWRWAKARHPKKGMRWIRRKYYMRFGQRDWWFFASNGSPEQRHTPYRLFHANSMPIVRHILVHSGLNPYDCKWFSYMEKRNRSYPAQTAPMLMGVR